MLDFEDGAALEEEIGTTFVASANPLLQNSNPPTPGRTTAFSTAELKAGGSNVLVNKANRGEFVDLFVQHALYGSCKSAVDDFLSGWRKVTDSPGVDMTTDSEVTKTSERI